MALRQIFAFVLLAFIIIRTFKDSKFGLLIFVAIIFINPASLLWGLDKFHFPLIISLVTIFSMILQYEKKGYKLFISSQHVFILFLFIFLCISAALSASPERSYKVLENWFKLFLFFYMITVIANSMEFVDQVIKVVVSTLLLLCLRGFYHYAVGYDHITGLPHSNIADRNDFALVIAMAIPLLFYLSYRQNGWKRYFYYALMIMFSVTVVLTYSRMGFILLSCYVLLQMLQSRHKVRYLVVVFVVFLIGLQFVPQRYIERMKTIQTYEQDASSMGRLAAWKAGISMMLDNPFTGIGLDCFELPSVYKKYDQTYKAHVAHNTYVQLGAEAGAVALSLFLLLNLLTLKDLLVIRKTISDSGVRALCNSIFNSLMIYYSGSIFLSVEDRELLYISIGIVVALKKIIQMPMNHMKSV